MFNRPCRKTGCPKTTKDKTGYCDKHKSTEYGWFKTEQLKGNRHQRGYGTDWEKMRAETLEADKGLCQAHLRQGIIKPGNQVDHIIPKSQGGTDEPNNRQTLCIDCHKSKTIEERKQCN